MSDHKLREYLNNYKDVYLKPTPDRIVDQKRGELAADFVLKRLNGETVLELGAGDQVWTPKLVDRFADVTTIDGSSKLLDEMGKKITATHWTAVESLFEDYRPEKRFDLVLATNVLEHVDDPTVVLNLAREHWLKDGGALAVVVPHALSLHRRLGVKMGLCSFPGQLGETDRRLGHKWCFTCYEMEKLILSAGFEIIESKGMFATVFPNAMLVQCSDEQLQGMFDLGLDLPIEYSTVIYFLAKAKP